MTREELINLKKTLENPNTKYYQAILSDGYGRWKTPFSIEDEIKKKNDVVGAINDIDTSLTDIVRQAAAQKIEIFGINVNIYNSMFMLRSYIEDLERAEDEMSIDIEKYRQPNLNEIVENFLAIQMDYEVKTYYNIFQKDLREKAISLNRISPIYTVCYNDFVEELSKRNYIVKNKDFSSFLKLDKDKKVCYLYFEIDFDSQQTRKRKK